MNMKENVRDPEQRRADKRAMGGAARLEREKKKGKLDVRARLQLLFDSNRFEEFGLLAASEGKLAEEESPDRPTPADGVITGIGEIEGRPVAVAAYAFPLLAGSPRVAPDRKVAPLPHPPP